MTSTTSFPLYRTDRDGCASPSGCGRAHRHLRIALMGLGTVGQGLCRLLEERRADLFVRHGLSFTITHVLVRNREEPRRTVPQSARLFNDAKRFLEGAFDLAVECMGGIEPAYSLTTSLLKKGIPVVSANKALLAEHGEALLRLAEQNDTTLRFEASVAAGIPILGLIERALQSTNVTRVCAILNGTSNYILTRMNEDGLSLEEALTRAQALGFAEADPDLDLTGMDAAQKLTVLVRALGSKLDTNAIHIRGLRTVLTEDCKLARAFGYALKPLAVADLSEAGNAGFVSPALVRLDHPLAGVSDVANGVYLEGRPLGSLFLSGPGAGALPTAASILDDLLVVAKHNKKTPGPNPRGLFGTRLLSESNRRDTTGNRLEAPLTKTDASGTKQNADTTGCAVSINRDSENQGSESRDLDNKGSGSRGSDSHDSKSESPRGEGWSRNWFLSLRLSIPVASMEDILDFLAASGLVFRSLQEQRLGHHVFLTGITTMIGYDRLYKILGALEATNAVESFRAYPVVDAIVREAEA